jgi:hypothetical protein
MPGPPSRRFAPCGVNAARGTERPPARGAGELVGQPLSVSRGGVGDAVRAASVAELSRQ